MELRDIIEAIDIVEYISQFVELQEKNGEWWGLSPFTNEKTPSFSVRDDGSWYDFSSGQGGNIFSFIKSYFHLSDHQTIEKLKEIAGYDGEIYKNEKLEAAQICKKFSKPLKPEKQSSAVLLKDNYMEKYSKNPDKLRVWINEGISQETLDKFQVRYDDFSNRLVYPIRNLDGEIVNIGGRTLDPAWKEKELKKYCYFFSWGTINTIYGMAENAEAIRKAREIILFEGAKSVLLADTWEIHNCGAILTSHLSNNQLKILIKSGLRIVFALDKDINILEDKNIQRLKRYLDVQYIKDIWGVLDAKDSPVDKGKDTFISLYNNRRTLR